MTVRRLAARLGAAVVGTAAFGIVTASPAAAIEGVSIRITALSRFEAGSGAGMTVVASKRSGGECLKVRWSMALRVEGLRLDQVEVQRLEEGPFPVEVRDTGNGQVQFTDARPDPGSLCRNRTVTAKYTLRFADDVRDGRVALEVGALDLRGRLLESTTVTRSVAGGASTTPSAEPSEEPSEKPSPTPSSEPTRTAAPVEEAAEQTETPAAGVGAGEPIDATPAGGSSGLLPVGIAVGGMMVFFGLTMLIRARRRLGVQPADTALGRAWYGMAATRRERRR